MIRIGAFVVGVFFAGWLMVSALFGVATFVSEPPVETAEHVFHKHPKEVDFSFEGPMGKFDRAQLQRGFQVYKEVCSACHGLTRVAFRDLQAIGYSEGQVKTIASEWTLEVPSIDPATGEATTRKPTAADRIPSPWANDTAARAANNNAIPPDLSLITKARHGGAEYVFSLLTGYQDPPAELAKRFPDAMPGDTTHYNPYFANLNLAMAAPLSDDQVTYGEGAPKPTKEQMAKDVAAFLTWTAEPKLENRHETGIAVMIFLIIFAGLCYGAYRNVWANVKH